MTIDQISPEKQQRYKEALFKARQYDLGPVIRRYATERRVSLDRAKEVQEEALRYLSLCSIAPDGNWTVTGEVDEFWHTFILFTERYADFCNWIGGEFIHHVPGQENYGELNVQEPADTASAYSRTLDAYQGIWKEIPPKNIWPNRDIFARPQEPMACDTGGGPTPQVCGCTGKPDPKNFRGLRNLKNKDGITPGGRR